MKVIVYATVVIGASYRSNHCHLHDCIYFSCKWMAKQRGNISILNLCCMTSIYPYTSSKGKKEENHGRSIAV